MSFPRTQHNDLPTGLEHGPLDPESSALTTRPPRLPLIYYFVLSVIFQTLCNKDLSWCVSHAQGIKAQAGCFYDYGKCLKDGGPTPVTYAPESRMMDEPTRGPFAVCLLIRHRLQLTRQNKILIANLELSK